MIINEDFFDEIEIQDSPEEQHGQSESVGYEFTLGIDPEYTDFKVSVLKRCLNNIMNTTFDLENLIYQNGYVTVYFNSEIKTFNNLWLFFLSIYHGVGGYYTISVYNNETQYQADAEMDYLLNVMSNPLKIDMPISGGNIDFVADIATLLFKRTVRGKEVSAVLNINNTNHFRERKLVLNNTFLSDYSEEAYPNKLLKRFYSSASNILKIINSEQNVKLICITDTLHSYLNVFQYEFDVISSAPYFDVFKKQRKIIIDPEYFSFYESSNLCKIVAPVWRWFHSATDDEEEVAVDYYLLFEYNVIEIENRFNIIQNIVNQLKKK